MGAASDDDDEFQDAFEETPVSSEMDLKSSLGEAEVALNLFLNNRFEAAKTKMEPWSGRSMYHALGHTTVHFIKAMMTCEPVDIERAVELSKSAVNVASASRRSSTTAALISEQVRRVVRGSKSCDRATAEQELHAELVYAECLLQRALLSFVEDESLGALIKGAVRLRQCYNSYRECERLLAGGWGADGDPELRAQLEAGVRLGLGTFHLLLAALPARVLRLLEWVGFAGERRTGLRLLQDGALSPSLRSPLCALVLLTWHLVAVYLFGTSHGDLKLCQKLLLPLLKSYPNGALVLYFKGRLSMVTAKIESGILAFKEGIQAQTEWRQFHHLCYWELMFAEAFRRQWAAAAHYAHQLYAENRWSKATYAYMTGVFLLAEAETLGSSETREAKRSKAESLLEAVPKLRVRIAGKSLPIEKFAAAKAGRYSRGRGLSLAHIELLYLWSGFRVLAGSEDLLVPMLAEVEAALVKAEAAGDAEDVALCLLLKGVCLRFLQSPFQAGQCLRQVTGSEKALSTSEAFYLVPNAWLELALLALDEGAVHEAKGSLTQARSYKGYLLQTRLHFRAHALGEKLSAPTPVADFNPTFP